MFAKMHKKSALGLSTGALGGIFTLVLLLALVALAGCGGATTTTTAGSSETTTTAAETTTTVAEADLAQGVTADTIKLGIISDLGGATAGPGVAVVQAWQDYTNRVNEEGGVNGRKIELVVEDGQRDLPREISLYKKLRTQDKVFTVVATYTTGSQNALQKDYVSDKNIVFPISKAAFLFDPVNPYVFTAGATYPHGYYALVDQIASMKPGAKVGIINPDDTYGQDALKWIEERATAKGLTLVKEVFGWTDVDVTSQISNLKRAGVDYAIIIDSFPAATLMFQTIDKVGWDVPIFSNINSTDLAAFGLVGNTRSFGENFEGTYFYADDRSSPLGKWIDENAQKTGALPEVVHHQFYLGTYADAMVFVEGLRLAGPNPTPESVRDAIEGIQNFDVGGILPPVGFGPERHNGSDSVLFVKPDLDLSAYVPAGDWLSVSLK